MEGKKIIIKEERVTEGAYCYRRIYIDAETDEIIDVKYVNPHECPHISDPYNLRELAEEDALMFEEELEKRGYQLIHEDP